MAVALASEPAPLLAQRGWLYILTESPRLALHDFEAALRLDPSHVEAYSGRGLARVRLGQDREGVADAEQALGHGEPTSAAAVQHRADLRPGGDRRRHRGPSRRARRRSRW